MKRVFIYTLKGKRLDKEGEYLIPPIGARFTLWNQGKKVLHGVVEGIEISIEEYESGDIEYIRVELE